MKNYRVWDSVTEIMYYPEDFKLVIDHGEPELHLQRKLGVVVAKENDIGKSAYLMQSTGLKDKNGVEIYEGDIVRWKKEFISPMDMRTKHKIDGNRKVYQKESGEWVMGQGNGLHSEVENIEVIGNIYENPELIKEAQ